MRTPRVTIGIPTYSRFAYLKEAVESALALDHDSFEVLISDDGENPEIRNWSVALAASDPRVRYQHTPKRLGLAGNWNAVVDASRGEFLALIGDDDRLLPGFLKALLPLLDAGAGSDVAFCNEHFIDARGVRLPEVTAQSTVEYGRDVLAPGPVARPEAVVWRNSVPMSAALIRVSLLRSLRFREDLNTPEIELLLRLVQSGGRLAFCPGYHAEYRTHSGSATSSGLWGDKLAEYLIAIPARPEAEPERTRFLSRLLVDAVGRCLLHGRHSQARRFRGCPEYDAAPRTRSMTAQRLCTTLPSVVGVPLYRLLYGLRRSI